MKSRFEKKVPSFGRARSSGWALPERCRAAIRTARRGWEESIKPRQPSYKISSWVRPGIRPAAGFASRMEPCSAVRSNRRDYFEITDGKGTRSGPRPALELLVKMSSGSGPCGYQVSRWASLARGVPKVSGILATRQVCCNRKIAGSMSTHHATEATD